MGRQVWDKFHRESSSWVGGWRVEGVSLGRDQKGKHYRQRDSLSHGISLGAGGSIAWTQKFIGTPVRKMGQYQSIKTWWSHWTLGLNPEVSWGYWKFLNKKLFKKKKKKHVLELCYAKHGLEITSISFTPPWSFSRKAQSQSHPRPTKSELHPN